MAGGNPADIFKTTVEGLQGLFGTGKSGSGTQDVTQFTQFRPEDLARIETAMGQIPGQTQVFQSLLSRLGQEARGAAPTLQTQFTPTAQISQFQPQFSTELDPLSQQLLSQGRGDLLAQRGAMSKQLAQRFAGQPGLAGALATINQIKSLGAANRLPLDIAQQQVGRNLAQQQLLSDIQQAFNQQSLQRSAQELQRQTQQNQALAQQLGLGQAARQEQAQFGATGLESANTLAQLMASLGQISGQQKQAGTSTFEERGGGLLSNVFG